MGEDAKDKLIKAVLDAWAYAEAQCGTDYDMWDEMDRAIIGFRTEEAVIEYRQSLSSDSPKKDSI